MDIWDVAFREFCMPINFLQSSLNLYRTTPLATKREYSLRLLKAKFFLPHSTAFAFPVRPVILMQCNLFQDDVGGDYKKILVGLVDGQTSLLLTRALACHLHTDIGGNSYLVAFKGFKSASSIAIFCKDILSTLFLFLSLFYVVGTKVCCFSFSFPPLSVIPDFFLVKLFFVFLTYILQNAKSRLKLKQKMQKKKDYESNRECLIEQLSRWKKGVLLYQRERNFYQSNFVYDSYKQKNLDF